MLLGGTSRRHDVDEGIGASGAGLKFWKRPGERVEGTERRGSCRRSGGPKGSRYAKHDGSYLADCGSVSNEQGAAIARRPPTPVRRIGSRSDALRDGPRRKVRRSN